jgi:Ca-activated chloride channel family protein
MAANPTTGELRGAVFDEDDLEVIGATVTLTSNMLIGGVRRTRTDATGRYHFPELLPGPYALTVTYADYAPVTIRELQVSIGRTLHQNVGLTAKAPEVIETLARQTVDTQTVDGGMRVLTKEFLQHIPTGRTYQQAVATSEPFIQWPRGFDKAGQEEGAPDPFVSTFAVDVDTASYTRVRDALRTGSHVDPTQVRVEELVNYFDYRLDEPVDGWPFAVDLEAAPSPLTPDRTLLRVGIQAERVTVEERPPVHLVYLIDVSGSMALANKLPLVKRLLLGVVDQLRDDDTIGIVTYAGHDSVALPPTPATERETLRHAIAALGAGGSTAGAAGLATAYDLADSHFRDGHINRVILATDGDFNVGLTGDALVDVVHGYRDRGIFLSTLGFGAGNDPFLEQLADKGNGHYLFVDSAEEADRVVAAELDGALVVVAKDAKVQVRFDETTVRSWRLVGYTNRLLDEQDFEDDAVDGGEIGAGHRVVAYYELQLRRGAQGPVAEVALRHKEPQGDTSTPRYWSFERSEVHAQLADASAGFRFGAAVAGFGEKLAKTNPAPVPWSRLRDLAAAAWDDETRELRELIELAAR